MSRAAISAEWRGAGEGADGGNDMGSTISVLICWSGERSRVAGQFLRSWLPRVVQAADPWMSDLDVEKGSRWFEEVAGALESAKVGICCLTPENLNAPWLLF